MKTPPIGLIRTLQKSTGLVNPSFPFPRQAGFDCVVQMILRS